MLSNAFRKPGRGIEQMIVLPTRRHSDRRLLPAVELIVKAKVRCRCSRNFGKMVMPELGRTDTLGARGTGGVADEMPERFHVKLKGITRGTGSPGSIRHPVVEIGTICGSQSQAKMRWKQGRGPGNQVKGTLDHINNL